MLTVHGAGKPVVVAFLVAGCLSILACEEPITPPPADPPIDSAEAVIEALARAYRTRDFELYRSLLAHEPSANADFVFTLGDPTELGETSWGYDEEVRIHDRMFRPETAAPPLPNEYWLQGLAADLVQVAGFSENTDLYSANGGLDGKLDPERWRALQSLYTTELFLDLNGNTDYKAIGEAVFIVIEDRTKPAGERIHWLLSWKDFACGAVPGVLSECAAWSQLKCLFR